MVVLSGRTCTIEGLPSDNTLTDGAFVRETTTLTIHTAADATGKCVLGSMYYLPPPPYCVWSSIEHLRTVNHVNIAVDPPTLLTTIHWVWALKPDGGTEYRQHLDTQDPGTTTGPIGVIPSADLGAWKFRSQSIINTTNCNLLPGISDLLEQTVNVTVCKPAWWNDQPQGFTHAVTPHVPARSIDIYVDPTLWGRLGQPARNAANDWTVELSDLGVAFSANEYPCFDGHCVNVEVGPVNPPQNCSEFRGGGMYVDQDGTFVTPSTIRLNDQYFNNATPERLRRSIAHELGHALGLDDSLACSPSSGLMGIPSTSCTELRDQSVGPQQQDAAAARSNYGNKQRKTCGY